MEDSTGHPKEADNENSSGRWHTRGFLPHHDFRDTFQSITYRLNDSVPAEVVKRLQLQLQEKSDLDEKYRQKLEDYLDAGYGKCILKKDSIAQIVADAWAYHNGKRYEIHAWVIMPNHVHILLEQKAGLSQIMHTWKSFTTNRIYKVSDHTGPVWGEDYWDRFIRNEAHYKNTVNYIINNPVKAGLVSKPEDWKWSSASLSL